jgi:hypothetical protein
MLFNKFEYIAGMLVTHPELAIPGFFYEVFILHETATRLED